VRPICVSHAPFRASEIAVNEAPKARAYKTPPKDRHHAVERRSFAPSERMS